MKPYNDPSLWKWNNLQTHNSMLDLYRDCTCSEKTPFFQSVMVTPAPRFPLLPILYLYFKVCIVQTFTFVVMPQQLMWLYYSVFASLLLLNLADKARKLQFNRPDTYYSNLQAVSMNHNNQAHFKVHHWSSSTQSYLFKFSFWIIPHHAHTFPYFHILSHFSLKDYV